MAPAPKVTFESLSRSLANGDYRPVYFIHGKEGYYTDQLVKQLEAIVPEADRDFGLNVVFATQTTPEQVIDLCRQLPMMIERQVVIVKEAQAVRGTWVDKLAAYAAKPTATTILAVCGRGDQVKAKAFAKAVKECGGVEFESLQVREYQIPALAEKLIKQKGLTVDPKAMSMLIDFIGADLSRMYNEIDKLAQILGQRAMITPEAVERHIGVSREYNNFELADAIAAKDVVKVFKIADYFAANPKDNPVQVTSAVLFGQFADLMCAYYAGDRSDRAISEALGLRNDFALRRIRTAMANYNPFQIIDIISSIRRFDTMSKGAGSRQAPTDLFRDLLYRILTTTGR
ncbi:MAG: DNA polymerase III subunit delta [Muribaculaceae bacterium]